MWDNILQGNVHLLEGGLVASTKPLGASATFYSDLFDTKNAPDTRRRVKWLALKGKLIDPHVNISTLPDDFCSVLDLIEKAVGKTALVIEVGGGIYQSRSCHASERFPNYIPVDLSATSICRYARHYHRRGVIADATQLPFKNSVVDAIFTRTILEHVPDPDTALREIFRVLKPGGVIIHQDAWFCRWWHRFGVVGLIPWRDMDFSERALMVASRFTEFWPWRASRIILRRVYRELLLRSHKHLCFGKLRANYDLHLGCDEDAASAIDPAEVLRFYATIGGDITPYNTAWSRIALRATRIVIRKPTPESKTC